MLLHQGIQEFVRYLELVDRSNQTIVGYEKELRFFNNFLNVKHNCPVYLEDITLKDMEDYLADQKQRGIASASRNRSAYILKSFYKYCHKKELVEKNIAALLEPVKIKQKERAYITEEEFEALSKAIKHPVIRTVVGAMFYTGGRVTEITILKLEEVDLENGSSISLTGKVEKTGTFPSGISFTGFWTIISKTYDMPILTDSLPLKKRGKCRRRTLTSS